MYLTKVIVFSVITSNVLGQGNDLENRLQILEKKITDLEEKNSDLEEKNSAFGKKFETSKLALTDGLASVENLVDELKTKLSELEKVTNILRVEESCAALGKLGYTQTGTYPIDPDGKSQNLPPVQATCSPADGKTSIGKNKFEIPRICHLWNLRKIFHLQKNQYPKETVVRIVIWHIFLEMQPKRKLMQK